MKNGILALIGNIHLDSIPYGDISSIEENTLTLIKKIDQPFFPKNQVLSLKQRSEFDLMIQEILIMQYNWYKKHRLNYQRLTGKGPKDNFIHTFILKPGRYIVTYSYVRWAGDPCAEVYASILSILKEKRVILKRSTNLSEWPGKESVCDSNFYISLFGDIDGDGIAEFVINEGKWESWNKSLYKIQNEKLTKILDIIDYGS